MLWDYLTIFHTFFLPPVGGMRGSFLDHHHANLMGSMEVKPPKVLRNPQTAALGSSIIIVMLVHTQSPTMSELWLKLSYQFMAPETSTPDLGDQFLAMTLDSPVPPDCGGSICPKISFLWWVQKMSLMFNLFSFILLQVWGWWNPPSYTGTELDISFKKCLYHQVIWIYINRKREGRKGLFLW